MRDRMIAAAACGGLAAGIGMAVERRVNHALRPAGRGPDESEIAPLERSLSLVGELGGQRPMRRVCLGHHHEASCILVEPMHDARSFHSPDAGKLYPHLAVTALL